MLASSLLGFMFLLLEWSSSRPSRPRGANSTHFEGRKAAPGRREIPAGFMECQDQGEENYGTKAHTGLLRDLEATLVSLVCSD